MKRAFRLTAFFLAIILLTLTLSSCGESEPVKDFSNVYNPETDFQYALEYDSLGISYITEAPDAFYFLNEGFLYVLDKKTMEVMPLCKKPNCLHDNSSPQDIANGIISCEAYVGGHNLSSSLFYYDNAIYVLGTATDLKTYTHHNTLQKISLDGTFLETFCVLKGSPQAIIRHRDMIYYTYPDTEMKDSGNTKTVFKLMSVSLKDKTETELLSDPLNSNLSFNQLLAYGKYIYLHDRGFAPVSDDTDSDTLKQIDEPELVDQFLIYDTETGETSILETPEQNQWASPPFPHQGELIVRYGFEDESNALYYKTGLDGKAPSEYFRAAESFNQLLWDDHYRYEDNRFYGILEMATNPTADPVPRKILVYNHENELVETITLDQLENNPDKLDLSCDGYKSLVASDDYLFIKTGSSNENDDPVYTLICVDKKQIGTGNITPFIVWRS